jgi:hypothetical protein
VTLSERERDREEYRASSVPARAFKDSPKLLSAPQGHGQGKTQTQRQGRGRRLGM